MKKERFKMVAAVYLILVRNGKILLLRRANTGYEDGNYSMVAGHLDGGETARQAVIREAREEAGIEVKPEELTLRITMHRLTDSERVDFFFEAKKWEGEIKNLEPHKCSDLSWFPIDDLPQNTIPYIARAIDAYRNGANYLEIGFEK
jgi:8-oxo-dGTP diphosphatase